jgi:UDP-N-acetylmuramyl pentapeptide phosphotransferase/UDP-N-acetylglucosamine-1-phosphate transferase
VETIIILACRRALLFYRRGGCFYFVWLMGMMYVTKLLDGLDGLASGIGVIGSL